MRILCAGNLLSSGLRVKFKKIKHTREKSSKSLLPALVVDGIYFEIEFKLFC